MDSSGSKIDQPNSRVSRNSFRVSIIGGGDDDFDIGAGMVVDGFGPSQSAPVLESSPSGPTAATSSTLDPGERPDSPPRTNRPLSISKPPRPQESLPPHHDGPIEPIRESPGSTRPPSVSTEPATDGSSDSTTASTSALSEPTYAGPRGPSHPYGLYPQGDGAETASQTAAIPLGFHGHLDQYRRRVGPDGEEHTDMIGPDGHTEQLPPYTRYPDEAYVRKAQDAESPAPAVQGGASLQPSSPVTQPPSTIPSIPGAGGLGLATRNPEFESTDDLGSPHSRQSSRSFTSDGSQRTDNATIMEKQKELKNWQIWMRQRLWGIIPYWTIVMAVVVLVIMGAILGSVIGTFASRRERTQRNPSGEPAASATSTSPTDAIPIPTPSDLAPLALGTYHMPVMPTIITNRVSNTCFQDPTLTQAWTCANVVSVLHLTINKTNDEYNVAINCNRTYTLFNNVYSYGLHPPIVPEPAPLQLVNDTFEPSRGPAWFRTWSYEKTVVLPELVLSPTTPTVSKRKLRQLIARSPLGSGPGSGSGPGGLGFKRKGIAQPGEKAWVCTWPETSLEIFIYAQQNSSWSGILRGPGSNSSSPWASSSSSPSATGASNSDPASQETPTPTPSEGSPTPGERGRGHWGKDSSKPPPPTATDASSNSTSQYGGPVDTDNNFTPPPPPYPRVVKLAERRPVRSTGPAPQCTQVEIQATGEKAKPVYSNGQPVVITILETEPATLPTPTAVLEVSESDFYKRSTGSSALVEREGISDMTPCGCMWFLT